MSLKLFLLMENYGSFLFRLAYYFGGDLEPYYDMAEKNCSTYRHGRPPLPATLTTKLSVKMVLKKLDINFGATGPYGNKCHSL